MAKLQYTKPKSRLLKSEGQTPRAMPAIQRSLNTALYNTFSTVRVRVISLRAIRLEPNKTNVRDHAGHRTFFALFRGCRGERELRAVPRSSYASDRYR